MGIPGAFFDLEEKEFGSGQDCLAASVCLREFANLSQIRWKKKTFQLHDTCSSLHWIWREQRICAGNIGFVLNPPKASAHLRQQGNYILLLERKCLNIKQLNAKIAIDSQVGASLLSRHSFPFALEWALDLSWASVTFHSVSFHQGHMSGNHLPQRVHVPNPNAEFKAACSMQHRKGKLGIGFTETQTLGGAFHPSDVPRAHGKCSSIHEKQVEQTKNCRYIIMCDDNYDSMTCYDILRYLPTIFAS